MKKRRRAANREPRKNAPTVNPASKPQRQKQKASKRLIAEVCVGLFLTGVLLIAKVAAEHTQTGEFIEQSFYDLLQLRLSSKLDAEALKVIVVDITGMKMDRQPRDRNRDFTNRDELLKLVREIGAQQPRAIGVDVDFTPYANQREQDRRFLDFCLSQRKPAANSHMQPVPVYVGLHEAVALGPGLSLGEPRFADLAAFIGFTKVNETEARKRIADWIEIPYEDELNHQRTWFCPSLATAVTQIHVSPTPDWLAWALDRVTFVQGHGYKSKDFLIDYSPLEALEKNTISLQDLDSSLRKNSFYDKYVFIGRGMTSMDSGDKFVIPGRRSKPYSGVYVHACAAYTLFRGALFEPSARGRLLLDVVVSMFVIFGVALVHFHYRRQAGEVAHHRVLAFLTFVAVLLTILIGFYAVHMTRMLWDDFVVVAAAVLSHRTAEEHIEQITKWLARSLTLAWRSLVMHRPGSIRRH